MIEEIKDGMHTVMWDGPGVYVARRLRGPTTFHKLPEGKQPDYEQCITVKEYVIKPSTTPQVSGNGLWR